MTQVLSRDAFDLFMVEEGFRGADTDTVACWFERGDGVAIYRNHDLGSAGLGEIRLVSYGSTEAQLETNDPPLRLPDIGNQINWRFQLEAVYRPWGAF